MYVANTTNLTFEINGNLTAVADFDAWPLQPRSSRSVSSLEDGADGEPRYPTDVELGQSELLDSAGEYMHFIEFHNSSGLIVTGNGVVDGVGVSLQNSHTV